jgi:hypothetical protein
LDSNSNRLRALARARAGGDTLTLEDRDSEREGWSRGSGISSTSLSSSLLFPWFASNRRTAAA